MKLCMSLARSPSGDADLGKRDPRRAGQGISGVAGRKDHCEDCPPEPAFHPLRACLWVPAERHGGAVPAVQHHNGCLSSAASRLDVKRAEGDSE